MSAKNDQKKGAQRLRRILFRLVAVTCGLVFGLLIVEAGLRIIDYSSPEFYQPDNILGYSLIPNMSGWYHKEGRSFVQTNSDGFRDVERTVEKPDGTYRIAVVGDSYVEGLQVGRDEMFTNFLLQKVSDCKFSGEKKVEILNFGVSGYGTAQELLLMRQKVWKYSPDLVLLVVTTNNDISDNSRYFKRTAIPYFVLKDEKLSLDNSFRQDRSFVVKNSRVTLFGTWFKKNLRVVQGIGELSVSLKYWFQAWKTNTSVETALSNDKAAAPVAEVGIDNQIYIPPNDENWRAAWQISETLIITMNAEANGHGCKFAVITGSNGVQVLPSADARNAYAKQLGVSDLFYPDRRIADFGKANSIAVITLAPELADYAQRNNVFLHGFKGNIGYGHWNQAGHRVAGDLIGKHLCESIVH